MEIKKGTDETLVCILLSYIQDLQYKCANLELDLRMEKNYRNEDIKKLNSQIADKNKTIYDLERKLEYYQKIGE